MFSRRPAMAASRWPGQISCAAEAIACALEPQTQLTVIAGTATGTPPLIAACRAGFMRLPAWMTLPITTLPTRAGSSPERRSVSRTTVAPNSVAGVPFNVPLKVPIAVRTGSDKTTSREGIAISFDSVWLSVQGSRIPPDAHYGGVARLSAHGKPHGTGKPEHRPVGGENDADCFPYACTLSVLEQRRQQAAAEALALPRIAHHDRDFRTERGRVDDIARDADELLDTVAHRGYREGHMPVIVDVRHGHDPLGRHRGRAAQHALNGRFE